MDARTAVANSLRTAKHVVVLTGAGVSAESGVPTFRDAQSGLWQRFKPEDLATPEAFARNPQLVWEWYKWRRDLVQRVNPNPAHLAIAELERKAQSFTLVTQNVDGLHHRAGSSKVLELHGNLARARCTRDGRILSELVEGDVPGCPHCGAPARPDIVWFGEVLPEAILDEAWTAASYSDVFLSVGTSALVQPAATLPHLALRRGAVLIEVNPEETPLTPYAHHFFRGKAGEILPDLVRAAWNDGAG